MDQYSEKKVLRTLYMLNHKLKGCWLFLLPLPDYRSVMEVLFSVKIFAVEFSPDLCVLRSHESKKVVFGNWSVRMGICMPARVYVTAR